MPDSIVGLEYLPNVHIDRINHQRTSNSNYVIVKISIYDYEEPTWSADDKFTSYFTVLSKFDSTGMDAPGSTSNRLRKGEVTLKYVIEKENSSFSRVIPFSSFTKSSELIRGTQYTKFTTSVFEELNIDRSNINYFCCSAIDIQQLKNNERLDLSYTVDPSYLGSLKSEKIIENGEEISNTTVFRDENGVPWSGPVHTMVSPTDGAPMYMAGSQHGETPEKILSEEVLSNLSKITYYIPIEMPSVDLGGEGANFRGARLPNIVAPGIDFRGPTVIPLPSPVDTPRASFGTPPFNLQTPHTPSFIHQMEFVEDMNRNVSNSLVVDLASVVLAESPVASIMYKYDKEAFTRIAQATNIQHIEVNRYSTQVSPVANRLGMFTNTVDFSSPTLIARSHNNKQSVKNKTLFKISSTEIVSVNPSTLDSNSKTVFYNGKNLTSDMIKGAQKIGKVEQNNLTLDPSLRPITFTDYDIKNAKDGSYKYAIKISTEDQHLLYCKQLLKDLSIMENKIQNLYNILIMKNVYNGDEFDIEFLEEFYGQYNIVVNLETGFVEGEFNTDALRNSYLVKSFEVLLEVERLIGIKTRAAQIANNLNLFTTDLDTILETANYFRTIITRFKTTYDLSDGESYEKSSSKSRKDRGLIEKTINLSSDYKRELLMPIGINFVNMNLATEGLPILNLSNFDARASKEVTKFFSGPVNANSNEFSLLPEGIAGGIGNIEETKYMNFSPAKIFFGGKTVDTTKITTESFDTNFFNMLKITTAALESEEDVSPENIIDEEQIEKYLDSREFLGDTTKFNNIILSSIKTRPALLPKIRQKFKFLENSILKSKKKDISLKLFDLQQPNNMIVEKIKENPNSVPLQVKALSLLKTPMTNFDLDTIDFDPLSNPQTQEVFIQNYLNIGKVQALMGFEKVDGMFMMDKPIYREINQQTHEKLKNMNVLCRIVQQSLDGLGVEEKNYNIHDKVFVMNSGNETQLGEEDV